MVGRLSILAAVVALAVGCGAGSDDDAGTSAPIGDTAPVCPEPTPVSPAAADVTLTLAPVTAAVGAPDDPMTPLTVSNAGSAAVEVGDVRLVEVLDAAGTAAVFTGAMTMEYRVNIAEPGASLTLEVLVPRTPCGAEGDATLPPGTYTMRAVTLLGTVDAPLTITS